MKNILFFVVVLSLILTGCQPKQQVKTASVKDTIWEQSDSLPVHLITLTNANGMEIKITNYGGSITSIMVPDKAGKFENVVLGFDSLSQYRQGHPFFGATIGRFGNRIGGAKFTLNDTVYNLAANENGNILHGGPEGFHRQVFAIDTCYASGDSSVLVLSRISRDLEQGFPGNLTVKITYILTADNQIKLNYEAETDKPTVLNLTNHSYFNLSGLKETILNHEVVLVADSITPTDPTLIPTGKITAVAGTPFDFTTAHKIGERIAQVPGGYDINYKLRKETGAYTLAAEVYEPVSGRFMQVYTTEPGIQFYSGNFLNGQFTGHQGIQYNQYYGLCLETQHFPDSPNKPQFPCTVLKPGEKYTSYTAYKFSVK